MENAIADLNARSDQKRAEVKPNIYSIGFLTSSQIGISSQHLPRLRDSSKFSWHGVSITALETSDFSLSPLYVKPLSTWRVGKSTMHLSGHLSQK